VQKFEILHIELHYFYLIYAVKKTMHFEKCDNCDIFLITSSLNCKLLKWIQFKDKQNICRLTKVVLIWFDLILQLSLAYPSGFTIYCESSGKLAPL